MSGLLSRRTMLSTMIAVPALSGPVATSQEMRAAKVLTAHSAAFALTSLLVQNSGITVEAIQPAKLPATRLASYLSGRGKAALEKAAQDADAVITFHSFWPEDPLYPHARRSNIRIVEIDAGRPLDGALNGIAIAEPSDDSAIYAALDLAPMPATGEGAAPWLAPSSLGRMADVLAADLSRVEPSSAKAIAANLAALKHKLLALKAGSDVALAEAENLTAIALSPPFAYLCADLGIDLRASITVAPNEWTAERAARLADWLKANDVSVVLLDTEPGPALLEALKGSTHVLLATVNGEVPDLLGVVESDLELLKAAFQPK